jgi:hypothetical protein
MSELRKAVTGSNPTWAQAEGQVIVSGHNLTVRS